MPAMSTRTGTRKQLMPTTDGLPEINHLPPLIITTLAAALLFLMLLTLAFFGTLNTITTLNRMNDPSSGASGFGASTCGVLSFVAFAGTIYFLVAVIKGVRDMLSKPYFTRGVVFIRREMQGRKAGNWLVLDPEYAGTDRDSAARITDEQRAASVDRNAIFQPRFAPARGRKGGDLLDESLKKDIEQAATDSTYLSQTRIAANQPPVDLTPKPIPRPRAVFRIDFASKAGFKKEDEVFVAHSPFLQHVYYVARLRNGEWEVYKNKSLI
jgi:hypothetical protein